MQLFRIVVAGISIVAMTNASLACTAVDITAEDGTVVAGRTMEWAYDMKWTLVSQPKGTRLALDAPKDLNLPVHEVETKHAVVGISAEVIPGGTILEGQNSAGLGMSGNFLPGFTTYQTVTAEDKGYVEILKFGSWALGSFATVAELREALPMVKVWTDPSIPTGPTPPTIHFVFTDRSGAGIVVEFVDGEMQIHDDIAHVLTNAPTYDWHLNNLRNYLNLSSVGVSSRDVASVNVTALGQGGGLVGLPGDYTPPSRFVRATFLRHTIAQPKDAAEAAQAIGHILNTVDIPIGVAQADEGGGKLVSDYTQWVAIKDLSHDRMMIADYEHRLGYLTIDLAPLFAATEPASVAVADLPYPEAAAGVEIFGR